MSDSIIYVLVLEDDQYQARELERRLTELGFGVKVISTELDFQQHMRVGGRPPFALAVVDMMLRWTDPSPNMILPPPDIMQEGSYTAGLRCARILAEKGVPCLIFTALDREKIPLREGEHFEIINKSTGYETLLGKVKEIRRR